MSQCSLVFVRIMLWKHCVIHQQLMEKIYCYVYTVSDVSLYCNSNMAFDLLLLACNVGLLGIKASAAITVAAVG